LLRRLYERWNIKVKKVKKKTSCVTLFKRKGALRDERTPGRNGCEGDQQKREVASGEKANLYKLKVKLISL